MAVTGKPPRSRTEDRDGAFDLEERTSVFGEAIIKLARGVTQDAITVPLIWLRMMVAAEPALRERCAVLWQEAKELNLIFGAIRLRTTLPTKR